MNDLTALTSDEAGGERKLLASIKEAENLLAIGNTSVYRLIDSGALETRKIGSRTLITMASINRVASEGASTKSTSDQGAAA